MLAIQAHCHAGHIRLDQQDIPQDAEVVVLFLPANATQFTGSTAALSTLFASLSPEQRALWQLQSQSGFAQSDLLNPAEDVWNNA